MQEMQMFESPEFGRVRTLVEVLADVHTVLAKDFCQIANKDTIWRGYNSLGQRCSKGAGICEAK